MNSQKIWEDYTVYFFSSATALMSSCIAVAGLLHSLEKSDKIREDERIKDLEAAKLLSPLALSAICEQLRDSLSLIKEAHTDPAKYNDTEFKENFRNISKIRKETVSQLRELIQFTNNEDVKRNIQAFVRCHQPYRSRFLHRRSEHAEGHDNSEEEVDWAKLYALIVALFDWARSNDDTKNVSDISEESIESAFKNMDDQYFLEFRVSPRKEALKEAIRLTMTKPYDV